MKTNVYYIQIWTARDVLRAWFAANTSGEAFDMAEAKYEGVTRLSVIHVYDASDFPFYVCTLRGPVSSVEVMRYGSSKRGFIRHGYSTEDLEIENVSNFIAEAVNRRAECIIEREAI